MDASLPSVSDPTFVPDMEDDCNLQSRNAFVNPKKMQKLMKDTVADQSCPNTNPYATSLKNQDRVNQERKMRLTSDSSLLSTAWCPIADFKNSWLDLVDNHLHNLIRPAGNTLTIDGFTFV